MSEQPYRIGDRCPRCDSPQPHLHPAVQHEGEVQPCTDAYHQIATPMNRPADAMKARARQIIIEMHSVVGPPGSWDRECWEAKIVSALMVYAQQASSPKGRNMRGRTRMDKSFPIVGTRFRPPAQAVLDALPSGAKLLLRRQPDNPYDGNAVQVLVDWENENLFSYIEIACDCGGMEPTNQYPDNPLHLGFIPREAAAKLAPMMDSWQDEKFSDTPFDEEAAGGELPPPQWPATLTFSPSGGPMVSFEVPE